MTSRPEKATILVIEDEPKMRRLLELQLGGIFDGDDANVGRHHVAQRFHERSFT